MKEKMMRQVDDAFLRLFMERLNERLMQEAALRVDEGARGLETAELGGLIIQKWGRGMAEAVTLLEQMLDTRMPLTLEIDKAAEVVDPSWRENQRARWGAQAGIDLSRARPSSRVGPPTAP